MNMDDIEMERIAHWIMNSDLSSTNIVERPYFLVIYNNRQWSDYFRQRRAENVQHVLYYQSANAIQQSILEHQFDYDLRRLVDNFIRQTQRPFPLKCFIDFTNK